MNPAELEQELQGVDKSWDLIPYLEVFKASLDGPWAAQSGGWRHCPQQGGLELSNRKGPFQPKASYDSVKL